MPDRLYVIGSDGRVAYKGGRGPFGFSPGEMEQSLVMLLLDEAQKKPQARVPLMDEKEAWQRLPLAGPDAGKTLPEWARALARTLPATTAAMLEHDYAQRMKSPLEPKVRAKMRWAAAHANRCEITQVQALADLRRAGANDSEIAKLQAGPESWAEKDRLALTFALKLTRSAFQVTDQETAALVKEFGDRQVVAMVLLLAHANFQDRLLLTLGLSPRPESQSPPLDVRLDREKLAMSPPAVPARAMPAASAPPLLERDAEWADFDFDALQRRVATQKERSGRVRVPSWEDVKKELPPGTAVPPRPIKIKWSLVCMGYQPRLAAGWSACTRHFGQESKQDRIFEESLFWVVTRSLQCFY
jgi:alkylhydroperoxidase family enzyme